MSKVSVHQRKARDFIQREDWGNALVELERMLEADGENPTLHNQIGDVYLRKDEVQRACEHFESAITLYAEVGLHNNAVALCKKVMRLRPGRFEMRYRLARLRFDQGFRNEASTYFRDYLEHVPDDPDYAAQLETNCREIVELLPEDAPLGKILEKLEAARRFLAAYEIVRKLSQQAADSGDEATSRRYAEKLRSLRILVERSGGRDLLAEPLATASAAERPVETPAAAVAGPGRGLEPAAMLDALLESETPVEPPAAVVAAPSIDFGNIDFDALTGAGETPPAVDAKSQRAVHEIDIGFDLDADPVAMPAAGSLDLPSSPVAPDSAESSPAAAPNSFWNEPLPLDDVASTGAAEYELPETSFADLAQDLGEEIVLPPRATTPQADATPTWTAAPSAFAAADAVLPADVAAEIEPGFDLALPSEVDAEDAAAAEMAPDWNADPGAWTEATAAPEPPPPAPQAVPPFASPAVQGSGWIEELRRAPVWIPTGDTLIDPKPDTNEGAHMELESVIDSFREQMARALDGDGAARYDLGVAYYEMGLYNEALAEFESAAACPGLEVQSFEMLAACLLQTGRHADVVELLLPVLAADGHSPRGRLGLQYSLGLAYEALGESQEAQRCFEEVALVDIDFKDVQTRLHRT